MMYQKLNCIQEDPVRRGYVDAAEHWRYSCGRNYILDDHQTLEIDRLDPCPPLIIVPTLHLGTHLSSKLCFTVSQCAHATS